MTVMSQIQRESLPGEQGTQAKALRKRICRCLPEGDFLEEDVEEAFRDSESPMG